MLCSTPCRPARMRRLGNWNTNAASSPGRPAKCATISRHRAFAREIFRGEPAMTVSFTCPDPRRLQDLIDAALATDEQEELSRHLDGCEACRQKLEAFVGSAEPWLAAVRELGEEPPVPRT